MGASAASARSTTNGNTTATTAAATDNDTASVSTAAAMARRVYTATRSVRSRRVSASFEVRPRIGRPIGQTTTATAQPSSTGLTKAPTTARATTSDPSTALAGPAPSQRAQKRVTLPGR